MKVDNLGVENAKEPAVEEVQGPREQDLDQVEKDSTDDEREDEEGYEELDEPAGTLLGKRTHDTLNVWHMKFFHQTHHYRAYSLFIYSNVLVLRME